MSTKKVLGGKYIFVAVGIANKEACTTEGSTAAEARATFVEDHEVEPYEVIAFRVVPRASKPVSSNRVVGIE